MSVSIYSLSMSKQHTNFHSYARDARELLNLCTLTLKDLQINECPCQPLKKAVRLLDDLEISSLGVWNEDLDAIFHALDGVFSKVGETGNPKSEEIVGLMMLASGCARLCKDLFDLQEFELQTSLLFWGCSRLIFRLLQSFCEMHDHWAMSGLQMRARIMHARTDYIVKQLSRLPEE